MPIEYVEKDMSEVLWEDLHLDKHEAFDIWLNLKKHEGLSSLFLGVSVLLSIKKSGS